MYDHCFDPTKSFNGVCLVRRWFEGRPRPIEWDAGIIVSPSESVTSLDETTLQTVIQFTASQPSTLQKIIETIRDAHKKEWTHVVLGLAHQDPRAVIPSKDSRIVLHAGI